MSSLFEVRMPLYPDCWESCGACSSGEVEIVEVPVKPGDVLQPDDVVVVLETGKTTLDIPTLHGGRVAQVTVKVGDRPAEGTLLLLLERD